MATITSTLDPLPIKKQRLNPARRKAAKARLTGQSIKPNPSATNIGASNSPAEELKVSLKAGQARASPAIVSSSTQKQTPCKPRLQPNNKQIVRGQSKPHGADEHTETKTIALHAPASVLLGGLAGCAAAGGMLLAAGVWSHIAGADSAILTARTAKIVVSNLLDEATVNLKAGTYNAPEALDMLRRTTLVYASTIPGGIPFVERLFREIDIVRRQRGGELDQALVETSRELASARRRGASASEMHMTVLRQLAKLSAFTSNATQDMIARNPELRRYLGKQKVPTVKVNVVFKQKNAATTARTTTSC